MDMKKEKLKEYLAPKMEVYAVTLEKGFAVSPELKGDSDGLGKKEVTNPTNSNVGQFEEGANWTNSGWNDQTGWN
jgi:hypothetical protein